MPFKKQQHKSVTIHFLHFPSFQSMVLYFNMLYRILKALLQ